MAADLPQRLDEYFMRLVIPFDEGRTAAIIQATRTDPATEDRVVVLDIDVFVKRQFAPDSPELWEEFEMLRTIKNDCFFKSLQKETWEKFR